MTLIMVTQLPLGSVYPQIEINVYSNNRRWIYENSNWNDMSCVTTFLLNTHKHLTCVILTCVSLDEKTCIILTLLWWRSLSYRNKSIETTVRKELMDFAESYSFVIQDSVQSFPFIDKIVRQQCINLLCIIGS